MMHFRDLSVKHKLDWLLGSVVVSVVLSIGIVSGLYEWYEGRAELSAELKAIAQITGTQSTAALVFADQESARENLRSLVGVGGIEAVCIFDRDDLLFSYVPSEDAVQQECQGLRVQPDVQFKAGHIWRIDSIELDRDRVGSLYIRASLMELRQGLLRYLLVLALLLLAGTVLALWLGKRIQRMITEPMEHLVGLARTVAVDQDYSVRATKESEDEIGLFVNAFNTMLSTIEEQNQALLQARDRLEDRVSERTTELHASNKELESFCYSVSHDLRTPVRAVLSFSQILEEDFGATLNADRNDYLHRIQQAGRRMEHLIDDMLRLSRISRQTLVKRPVDLSNLAREVERELAESASEPDRRVQFDVQAGLQAEGDPNLLRILLSNLIGNALKYTARQATAHIQLGRSDVGKEPCFYIKDDGVGFDMLYAQKLFGVFERLHGDEFEGTGIGLATAERIVLRHGGRIWGEGESGKGATFYFTLAAVADSK